MINNFEFKSVLFLGIGGVSMHQLAIALNGLGIKVVGYDVQKSVYTKLCEDEGIQVSNKFEKDFCSVDLCVKNGAISDNNPYILRLRELNCKIIDRAELLGWLCTKFKCVIAVAGTHGKSTTSALIYEMLRSANKKVSCHIGADVCSPRFKLGDDYFVVEACEYKKSFLKIHPTISVVTNVEAEHMDCYKSLFNLRSCFLTFLKRGEKRFVFLDNTTKFFAKYKNIKFVEKKEFPFTPKLKGEHNLKNISLAMEVANYLEIEKEIIEKIAKNFAGIPRRYEKVGEQNNMQVYIDYAHHPTEINEFIKTFKSEFKNSAIVFQPHTFSRTKLLLHKFISALKDVENLIIFKEYPARETKEMGMSAKELFDKLKMINSTVKYCENINSLIKNIPNCDAVAFVGAGDINQTAENFARTNQKNG